MSADFTEQLLRNLVASAKLHSGLFSTHYTLHPDEINAARLWLSYLDEKEAKKREQAQEEARERDVDGLRSFTFPPSKDSKE